ncbi:MAG: IS701 family transposase [Nitrososphaerota archaeon]|nr:IS701 family transposase [Nitrososphaerota archaeon]
MLPITEYPSFVREAKSYLESGFDDWRQVENAMRYLTGLIAIPERKNVSSINRSFLEYRNQASMNNFITDSTWDDGEFHRAVIQMVKDEVGKQGVRHGTLVIDDTFLEKSGEEMEGVGWFWDHSQNKSILAHNVVSTHYIAGKFHVPLDFDIYVKRKDCADKKQFRTKVEIAKELVEKAAGYGIPVDVVVFDSWYMSEELTSFIREKGIEAYVAEEKGDRIVLSDDSKTETNLSDWAKTIPKESFEPVQVYTSLLGEKRTLHAFCTSVRMKHLDGTKVRMVVSYKDERLDASGEGPSFYVTNMRFWESKKILQTQAMRWPIEGFHRDAKQSLGLEDYQVRKIKGVKRHIAMVFFAYVLLQLGAGFDRIMGNLKANLRTIGSRCRLAGTEVLSSLIRFVVKMAHRDMDARKIMDLLTKPLDRSGYWR